MSFGWSAGDIAQAVGFLVKVARALDDAQGAVKNYQDSIMFLQSLTSTLQLLGAFSERNIGPIDNTQIQEQVDRIRKPVEEFLATAPQKFESALGQKARSGYHIHLRQKLKWHFKYDRIVENLEKRIGKYLQILTISLQKLTIEMSSKFEQSLTDKILSFSERNTQLLLQEVRSMDRSRSIQHAQHVPDWTAATQMLGKQITLGFDTSQKQLQFLNKQVREIRWENSNYDLVPRGKRRGLVGLDQVVYDVEDNDLSLLAVIIVWDIARFLKALFQTLANKFSIFPALTPKLLSKYNITFYDARVQRPQILDYNCFKKFTVFKDFLESSFPGQPGQRWVKFGLYQLADARNGTALTADSWSKMVLPGSCVKMSMSIDAVFAVTSSKTDDQCPVPNCSGWLGRENRDSLRLCTTCGVEVNFAPQPCTWTPDETSLSHAPHPKSVSKFDDCDSGTMEFDDIFKFCGSAIEEVLSFKRVLRAPQEERIFWN